jgi:hypothetical protein
VKAVKDILLSTYIGGKYKRVVEFEVALSAH